MDITDMKAAYVVNSKLWPFQCIAEGVTAVLRCVPFQLCTDRLMI